MVVPPLDAHSRTLAALDSAGREGIDVTGALTYHHGCESTTAHCDVMLGPTSSSLSVMARVLCGVGCPCGGGAGRVYSYGDGGSDDSTLTVDGITTMRRASDAHGTL